MKIIYGIFFILLIGCNQNNRDPNTEILCDSWKIKDTSFKAISVFNHCIAVPNTLKFHFGDGGWIGREVGCDSSKICMTIGIDLTAEYDSLDLNGFDDYLGKWWQKSYKVYYIDQREYDHNNMHIMLCNFIAETHKGKMGMSHALTKKDGESVIINGMWSCESTEEFYQKFAIFDKIISSYAQN